MNENLNNPSDKENNSYIPQAPNQTEPKFDSYTEKTDYFFNIDKQIEDKKRELSSAAKQSIENPTAPKEAYIKLMGVIKNDIEELNLKKKKMMHSKKTVH